MWYTGIKQNHKGSSCQVSNVSSLRKVIAFGVQAQPKPGFHHHTQTWPLGPGAEPREPYALPHINVVEKTLHTPEVLATQRLQALSQGAVQAGLCPLPCRLDEGGEDPPEQAQQKGVPDQLRADHTWMHSVGGDPCA